MSVRPRTPGAAVVFMTAVLGASASCSSAPPLEAPPIELPSRDRDAKTDPPPDAGEDAPSVDPTCDEPDLVACFPFEGSIVDQSPSGLTPSSAAGVTFEPGKHGSALRLSVGTTIRFPAGDSLDVAAATVEAWVYRDVTAFGDDTVFDADARFSMTVEQNGALRCDAGGSASRGGSVPIAQWVHVACTFGARRITSYVAGAQVATAAGALVESASAGAAIGDDTSAGGKQLLGRVDSLRVFSIVRTAAQVAAAAQP